MHCTGQFVNMHMKLEFMYNITVHVCTVTVTIIKISSLTQLHVQVGWLAPQHTCYIQVHVHNHNTTYNVQNHNTTYTTGHKMLQTSIAIPFKFKLKDVGMVMLETRCSMEEKTACNNNNMHKQSLL